MASDGARPAVVGPDSGPEPPYPLRLNGKVIKGFGRGSSELGIPTANIPLDGLSIGGHTDIDSGVYYGYAGLSPSAATQQNPPGTKSKYSLMTPNIYTALFDTLTGTTSDSAHAKPTLSSEKGAIYPMVMSIGWNPFYKNTVRSVEVHVMHQFEQDFYGSHMNLVVMGFIRPELDYVSKESLIQDIKTDIDVAGRSLARKAYAEGAKDRYLLDFEGRSENAS